jgi:hypothetical protein
VTVIVGSHRVAPAHDDAPATQPVVWIKRSEGRPHGRACGWRIAGKGQVAHSLVLLKLFAHRHLHGVYGCCATHDGTS